MVVYSSSKGFSSESSGWGSGAMTPAMTPPAATRRLLQQLRQLAENSAIVG